eukprot:jgi/Ulvmu1/12444/UM009_0096.1
MRHCHPRHVIRLPRCEVWLPHRRNRNAWCLHAEHLQPATHGRAVCMNVASVASHDYMPCGKARRLEGGLAASARGLRSLNHVYLRSFASTAAEILNRSSACR